MATAPVHYLGNKTRLLDPISQIIQELHSEHSGGIVDMFSGSGVVSARLSELAPVLSVDVQHYSGVLTRAQTSSFELDFDQWMRAAQSLHNEYMGTSSVARIIEYEALALAGNDDLLLEMLEEGSGMARLHERRDVETPLGAMLRNSAEQRRPGDRVIFHYYAGPYFGYAQALALDALAATARNMRSSAAGDTALAVVLGVASDLSTSVGNHFAQPAKVRDRFGVIKTSQLRRVASKRSVEIWSNVRRQANRYERGRQSRHPVTTATSDFRTALADQIQPGSIVYADPPYTRDHYSRFYHVLETIVLGDEPGFALVSGRRVPRGLYRRERHQSDFSIVSRAPIAFQQLFEGTRRLASPVVLSYSPVDEDSPKPRARAINLPLIIDIAERAGYAIEVRQAHGLQHSRFNSAELSVPAPVAAETILIAIPS